MSLTSYSSSFLPQTTRIRHKDYIFQKRLALRLPIDSFRFDFRYVFLGYPLSSSTTSCQTNGNSQRHPRIRRDLETNPDFERCGRYPCRSCFPVFTIWVSRRFGCRTFKRGERRYILVLYDRGGKVSERIREREWKISDGGKLFCCLSFLLFLLPQSSGLLRHKLRSGPVMHF